MNKEDIDITLKRVQSKISNGKDHGDQERIRRPRALSTIVITEGATSPRKEDSKVIRLLGSSRLDNNRT